MLRRAIEQHMLDAHAAWSDTLRCTRRMLLGQLAEEVRFEAERAATAPGIPPCSRYSIPTSDTSWQTLTLAMRTRRASMALQTAGCSNAPVRQSGVFP